MIWFLLILLIKNCSTLDGRYECGANGRFEYCIDGIPGCVIGCHCYPGFYFDTNTKICEPNTKLIKDFRRTYMEGSGANNQGFPDATTQAEPSPQPTTYAMDQPVDEIAKDTGDISDWLYNQFFKTIENQVINKTDDDDILKTPTRRSGGFVPKRKFSKKRKGATKRGLRRKLLRISGDDSMFDDDSRSVSDDTSSSSSWESWGYEPPDKQGSKGKHDDRDHDHRKIVVYNKKPKPPLPSFIFLPNIETPFYPPIGLPAPAMPMYPMIPVPPICLQPGCEENQQNSTTAATDTTTTSGTATKDLSTTMTPSADTPAVTTAQTTASPLPNALPVVESLVPSHNPPTPMITSTEPSDKPASRNGIAKLRNRNKLLQRLRELNDPKRVLQTVGTMIKKPKKSKKNHYLDQLQDATRFDATSLLINPILEENPKPEQDDLLPYEDDVDFKYLTQLIHRVDINETTPTTELGLNSVNLINKSPVINRKSKRIPIMPGHLQAGMPSRRTFDTISNNPDDSYYTNLGRQIAKLIRDINPNDVGEVNVDIDQMNPKSGLHLFPSGNSFPTHSYWERFVRSPLRLDLSRFSKLEDLNGSNEKLFNLENQAQVAAKSPSFLNLPQLEDVINAIERIQKQTPTKKLNQNYQKTSNNSLNISLLPQLNGKSSDVLTPATSNMINNKVVKNNSKKKVYDLPLSSNDGRFGSQNYANDKYLFIKQKDFKNKVRNEHITKIIPPHPIAITSNLKSTRSPNLTPVLINHGSFKVNRYIKKKKDSYDNAATIGRGSNTHVRYGPPKTSSYFFNEEDFV